MVNQLGQINISIIVWAAEILLEKYVFLNVNNMKKDILNKWFVEHTWRKWQIFTSGRFYLSKNN